jgi:thymidylate synthase
MALMTITIFKECVMENDKKSYMQKLADKIVEWDKKIDELKIQGNEAASVMKEDYTKMAADLKVKKKDAEEKLKQLKSVGGEGWEELKKGAELAVNDLSDAVNKAFSKFKKQP